MGILQRIALVLKSYVRNTGDRLDRIVAEEELRQKSGTDRALSDLTMRTRGSVDVRTEQPEFAATPRTQLHRLDSDYRMLGLTPGADLSAVEEAWRGLARRADPKRFPAGSEEEKKAGEILRKLNQSYERIREELNPTEGRFGQLEL